MPELPSSVGTNEVGGKTYQPSSDSKWEFYADGTYKYFDKRDDGVWTERHTGNYSWNSSSAFKTLTLAPQRAVLEGSTLYDKAGWKAAARSWADSSGLTDHLAEETGGAYTSLTAFINDYADHAFALRLYNYTMNGDAIDIFDNIGAYGYGTAKGGKVVVKNNTSSTLTVKTYSGYAETEATATVSSGQSSQVFSSGADTFLTKIQITTSGSFTELDTESGSFFFGGIRHGLGSGASSYETEPLCVSGGRTTTITVNN
jgi:hypothetical protein